MRKVFTMYSSELTKLATMIIMTKSSTEALQPLFPVVIGATDCRLMIEAMRHIPLKNACVFMYVEAVGLFSFFKSNPTVWRISDGHFQSTARSR